MSGVEWTIVTSIGVCLVLLFVVLEVLFPIAETPGHRMMDRNDARDRQPVAPSVDSHTIR